MDKKLIYAADDEENIREILQAFLKEAGYAVRVFETGDSLLKAFSAHPADMVILDIMMPGTDGIGVCKKLLLKIWTKIPILRKFLLHPVCFGADKSDATHKFMHSPQA